MKNGCLKPLIWEKMETERIKALRKKKEAGESLGQLSKPVPKKKKKTVRALPVVEEKTVHKIKNLSWVRRGAPRKYYNYEYKRIRKEVLRESRFKCSSCGSPYFLRTHHVDFNRENNAKENLRVLCHECHCVVHNFKMPVIELGAMSFFFRKLLFLYILT